MNLLGGHQFDDAPALDRDLVKTITRTESRLGEPLPFVPSPGIVPAAVPFSDAGERYARGDWSIGRQWEPAAPSTGARCPTFPPF
jgi:hypothetical protein